ncbi:MAG: VCBS repeat-containing protein [Gemmataceae bacterium]|nr:VCBS repeat-containing protein [Gemmataceae bacterium]
MYGSSLGARGTQMLLVRGLFLALLLAGCGGEQSDTPKVAGADDAVSSRGSDQPVEGSAEPHGESKRRVTHASLRVEPDTNLLTPWLQQKCDQLCVEADPGVQGWDTEVLSEVIEKQLKAIGQVIKAAAKPPGDTAPNDVVPNDALTQAHPLATSDYQSSALRPADLQAVWQDQGARVFRPARQATAASALAPPAHEGPPGFAAALKELAAGLRQASDVWVKFKLFRIADSRPVIVTRAYYQAAGRTPQGIVQQGATWRCRWRMQPRDDGRSVPQIERIEVTDYEESLGTASTWFSDCTRAALADEPAFDAQLKHGLNYWVQRIDRSYRTGISERYGLAVGDVNGDELDDVFVCQPVGIPARLLVQQPDGTYRDRATAAGVDFLDHIASALFLDLDNDGDQDLVLSTLYRVLFLANDGQGRFTLRHEQVTKEWDVHSLAAADYDGDGDLDVLLTVGTGTSGLPRGDYFDARDGGGTFLFRNDISADPKAWAFTDVTAEVGLKKYNYRVALAAAWEDYDEDGDPDLYVANDFGPNDLFRNDGGKFVNVALEARVEDYGSGMSVSWGDYNRDGRMDLYVGNMFSSAGNRITFQAEKLRALAPDSLSLLQRFAKGNSLFENLGNGRFSEVGDRLGVEMGRWAWSSLFVDLNNDGWQDLYVVNGYVTNDMPDDL